MISINNTGILSEISIDHFHFKVARNPVKSNSCILWFRDEISSDSFEALGQFSQFDKRNVLLFITRYVTNDALREEIDGLRFERRVAGLSATFFREIELMSVRDKRKAYRHLFCLDDQMHKLSLSRRRRIMAGRFHPDAGGDHQAMVLINEAYDFLVRQTSA